MYAHSHIARSTGASSPPLSRTGSSAFAGCASRIAPKKSLRKYGERAARIVRLAAMVEPSSSSSRTSHSSSSLISNRIAPMMSSASSGCSLCSVRVVGLGPRACGFATAHRSDGSGTSPCATAV